MRAFPTSSLDLTDELSKLMARYSVLNLPMLAVAQAREIQRLSTPPAKPTMEVTAAEKKATDDHAAAQWREAKGESPKVTCECGLRAPIRFLHRCLYCSCFFCTACAEVHFGETQAEYQARVKVVDA